MEAKILNYLIIEQFKFPLPKLNDSYLNKQASQPISLHTSFHFGLWNSSIILLKMSYEYINMDKI